MKNTLEYKDFILTVQLHPNDYLIGNIRKNKYFSVKDSPLYFDVAGESVKELREEFEKKVDKELEKYYKKQKELEETNNVTLTYKDFNLRVTKDISSKLVGILPGTNSVAPKFKGNDLGRIRASFERYIDNLLIQVNIHYQLCNYNRSKE